MNLQDQIEEVLTDIESWQEFAQRDFFNYQKTVAKVFQLQQALKVLKNAEVLDLRPQTPAIVSINQ
jgi:hypothetical protein